MLSWAPESEETAAMRKAARRNVRIEVLKPAK
jgi:hypothetical protein